jgi:hypothetical protein
MTKIVTFRRWDTPASPCSSVWQNGDAGLTVLSQGIADAASPGLVTNDRLETVDAARGGIGGHQVFLQALEFGGELGRQEPPFVVGACFGAEGA